MKPVEIRRPAGTPVVLYDSPHSGRFYPPDWPTRAKGADLRRGEDAYVDELLDGSIAHGALLLCAVYPRCYIDVNRDETDIDAELLAEPWPGPLAPTDKSARGLGLIRRYVTPGVEVNERPLTVAEVQQRLDLVYRPYHSALRVLVDEIRRERRTVLHLDWHSMKSVGNTMTPDGAGAVRPDFVVSDRQGASADSDVTNLVVSTLRNLGYQVSVNDPYTGGTIVQRTGNPAAGVHSVQIEINRALYLDEARVEKSAGFDALSRDLTELTRVCAASRGSP